MVTVKLLFNMLKNDRQKKSINQVGDINQNLL